MSNFWQEFFDKEEEKIKRKKAIKNGFQSKTNKNSNIKYNKEHRKKELKILKENVNIIQFLSSIGFEPNSWNYNRVWYISPIRKPERTASFCVYTDENKWWDFGIHKGGSIIDLFIHLYDFDYITAVKMLRKEYNHLLKDLN
jgi:hypothetical protein